MKKQARRAAKVVVFDEVAARIRKASRLAEVKVSLNYFFRFCDKEHRGAITGLLNTLSMCLGLPESDSLS